MSRRFRLTREGRVFVAVTILVGVAAINTGNNLLYLVLSLLLGLLLLSGVLSDLSLHGLRAELTLPARLEVGRPGYAEIFVRNRKRWLSSFSIVASPTHQDAPLGDALFLKIEPGERAAALVAITPARRGQLAVAAVELRTQFPFALVEKRRRLPVEEHTLVHPRSGPLELSHPSRERQREGDRRVRRGQGDEVIGLRELRPFEVASDLHFARSAALGRWMKREHGDGRVPTSILILDERRDEAPDFEERLERRIEEVAALARALHRGGEGVGLVTAARRVEPIGGARSLTPLLDVLATVEALPAGAPPPAQPGEPARPAPAEAGA